MPTQWSEAEQVPLGVHRPRRFASYSGQTEPSAPTHVLMHRVSVPCLSLWERWPAQRGRRGQTMTIPALSVTCGDSSPKGRARGRVPRYYIGAYRGGVRPSAPTTVYHTCALSLACHSEPVTDVTGVGIRPPLCLRRQRPPPTLSLRGKGAIDNRLTQGRVSRRGGRNPSLFGVFREKILRKGEIEIPLFLNSFWLRERK